MSSIQDNELRVVDADGHVRVFPAIYFQAEFQLADSRTPDHIASKLNELAGSNSGMTFTCNEIPSRLDADRGIRVYLIQAKYLGTAHESEVGRRFQQLVTVDLGRADADLIEAERHAHNA